MLALVAVFSLVSVASAETLLLATPDGSVLAYNGAHTDPKGAFVPKGAALPEVAFESQGNPFDVLRTSMVRGKDGALYVGSENRLEVMVPDSSGHFTWSGYTPYQKPTPLALVPRNSGEVWIGARHDRLMSHELTPTWSGANAIPFNQLPHNSRSCHQATVIRDGSLVCIGEQKFSDGVRSVLWVAPYSLITKDIDTESAKTLWSMTREVSEGGIGGILRSVVYNPADKNLYVLISVNRGDDPEWESRADLYKLTLRRQGVDGPVQGHSLMFLGTKRIDPEVNQPMAAGERGLYLMVVDGEGQEHNVILLPLGILEDKWEAFLKNVPPGPILVRSNKG